ncbi:hypothetical protein PoB_000540200 [Plakobranchus ocellatus]|uniref:Uncharacterized protein n=1 Tax=Plakobranchus ocellatus TaxID=259542 RepID=A0AAV3Y8U2_9GAST|nr:hypothetical protein PoB_000540200 [Plakobranchus ocellatus]
MMEEPRSRRTFYEHSQPGIMIVRLARSSSYTHNTLPSYHHSQQQQHHYHTSIITTTITTINIIITTSRYMSKSRLGAKTIIIIFIAGAKYSQTTIILLRALPTSHDNNCFQIYRCSGSTIMSWQSNEDFMGKPHTSLAEMDPSAVYP